MSVLHQRGNARIEANLTPMIDMTFLLIVFFVLVTQIVDLERVELSLPTPTDPASTQPGDEQRTVINVVPEGDTGRARSYRVGARAFPPTDEGLERLTEHLAGLYATNPALRFNLRADRSVQYEWLHPVLQAVSAAASQAETKPRLNLVILREE